MGFSIQDVGLRVCCVGFRFGVWDSGLGVSFSTSKFGRTRAFYALYGPLQLSCT